MSAPVATNEKRGRGRFIVFEGIENAGKTSQSKQLVDWLNDRGTPATWMCFPERDTRSGRLLDQFLKGERDTDGEPILADARVCHLYFAVNRWEASARIKRLLSEGTTVVCDRYAFSGTAYTRCKPDAPAIEWAKLADTGLPRPDLVLWLKIAPEAALARRSDDAELFNDAAKLALVHDAFSQLSTDGRAGDWRSVNADREREGVADTCKLHVHKLLQLPCTTRLHTLYWDEVDELECTSSTSTE